MPILSKKEAALLALRMFAPRTTKLAQEENSLPLADAAENIAVPTVFGLGGYLASKKLGLGEKVGLPDWLVGPAVGLGAAMPAARFAKRTVGRMLAPKRKSPEEIAAEEQQLRASEEQALLEQQSQQMLAQAAAQGYGIPQPYADQLYEGAQAVRGAKYGSFDPAVSAIEAFMPPLRKQADLDAELLLAPFADLAAAAAKPATDKMIGEDKWQKFLKEKSEYDRRRKAVHLIKKRAQLGQPKPMTEYRISAEQTPGVMQQAGQMVEQQQQKGMMQQAQQAAIAKQLQGYIQSAMPKPPQQQQQKQQGQR